MKVRSLEVDIAPAEGTLTVVPFAVVIVVAVID